MDRAHFQIVAGEQVADLLDTRLAAEAPVMGLVAWQEQTNDEGFRAAELVESIYGWTLRHASGLQGFGIIAGARMGTLDGSYEDAERAAKAWVAQDPAHRYVFVRRSDG